MFCEHSQIKLTLRANNVYYSTLLFFVAICTYFSALTLATNKDIHNCSILYNLKMTFEQLNCCSLLEFIFIVKSFQIFLEIIAEICCISEKCFMFSRTHACAKTYASLE